MIRLVKTLKTRVHAQQPVNANNHLAYPQVDSENTAGVLQNASQDDGKSCTNQGDNEISSICSVETEASYHTALPTNHPARHDGGGMCGIESDGSGHQTGNKAVRKTDDAEYELVILREWYEKVDRADTFRAHFVKVYRPANGGPYTWDPIHGWITEDQRTTLDEFGSRPYVIDSKLISHTTSLGIKMPKWHEERFYAPPTGGPYVWHTVYGWIDEKGRLPYYQINYGFKMWYMHSEEEVARMKQGIPPDRAASTNPGYVYRCKPSRA